MLRSLSTLALASLATARVASLNNSQALAYDYVVIGAGTSGLVIANRLSELENVTVAVIEAGDSVYSNENVTSPSAYGAAFGTDIDWAYQTTNQTYGGGAKQTMRAGKAIGGTSTINGMAYTRAEDIQVDAWETIGNEGWNWATLLPYYKKSQKQQLPTETQVELGASFDASFNGFNGSLRTGWKSGLAVSDVHTILNETYASLNVPWNVDINSGNMHGYNFLQSTYDAELNVRHDAGRAYYFPIANRTNLHLYTNTQAQRIVWASDTTVPTASGVEVLAADSSTPYTISANAEVIVSAGALASPLILELSGIGNPTILNKYNISVVVDLPTVGENLQDNINAEFVAATAPNVSYSGSPTYVAYPTAQDIFNSSFANVSASILAALPAYADTVALASDNVTKASDLLDLFKIQHELIFSTTSEVPLAEILITPGASQFTVEYWALLPFSRGNVHISSSTPGDPAILNPNYFLLDWDSTEQIATAEFVRKIFATEPFAALVGDEVTPGLDVVPANGTYAEWFDFLKGAYRSNFHPVASLAMMPRDKGGVVDTNLKVYGTSNVRVVDASVLPYQVCGHLVSTLYALAERTADLIKSGS